MNKLSTLERQGESEVSHRCPSKNGLAPIQQILSQNREMIGSRESDFAMKVLERTSQSTWQSYKLRKAALESSQGLALAVVNKLPQQAKLHLRELQRACNLNVGEFAVSILRDSKQDAKPFAVCSNASRELEVKGNGYSWHLQSLDISNEPVPSRFLQRLVLLRRHGIEPDSMYIAVPYTAAKPSLLKVVAEETGRGLDAVRSAADAAKRLALKAQASAESARSTLRDILDDVVQTVKMPDPVLVIGFGEAPCILIEIGRWV